MEQGVCPDCHSSVGGHSHQLDDSNRHAPEFDGALGPLWSEDEDRRLAEMLLLEDLVCVSFVAGHVMSVAGAQKCVCCVVDRCLTSHRLHLSPYHRTAVLPRCTVDVIPALALEWRHTGWMFPFQCWTVTYMLDSFTVHFVSVADACSVRVSHHCGEDAIFCESHRLSPSGDVVFVCGRCLGLCCV